MQLEHWQPLVFLPIAEDQVLDQFLIASLITKCTQFCLDTMRLLTFGSDGVLKLTPDLIDSDRIPPYAILSHTWAEDKEVTYQDLENNVEQTKEGYAKILFCAQQAKSDGLDHFWVDTCCIDKSSSAELAEAINSMFMWYRNAVTCYVYLSDVTGIGPAPVNLGIAKSRWFTRGWTLQELLAPKTVQFFTREGKSLGDRTSLSQHIAKITGIPEPALLDNDLSTYGPDEKISWAKGRQTRREEDKAYSLLGLLGVNLSLIYGERFESAFERLHEAVERKQARSDGLLPRANVHWVVSRSINSLFTGRSELLKRIQSALCRERSSHAYQQRRFVITGMGGQGKSEVCVQIANMMRQYFWGVFWIDVSSENTAQDGFLAISRALGHSVQTVQDCLQVLASATRRWLLILDNADDPEFDYASYFPTGNRGAVLLTSRIPECRQYSTVGTESLGSLDMSHSTQLLFKAAQIPEQSWHACRTHALEITELLGSHTLALIQAGAYIGQGYCRLDQYAEKFQQQRRQLLSHHPAQQQSRYQNVYATFEASVDVLKLAEDEVGQDALDLLGLLSMLHNSTMPLQIFQDAWAGARLISRGEMSDLGCTQQEQLSRRTWRPIRPWRSIKISSQPKVQTTAEMSSTLGKVHVSHIPGFINPHHEAWDDSRLKKAIVRLNSLSLITCHYSNVHEGLSMHPLAHAWAKDRMKKDEQERVWVRATCTLTMSLGRSGIWRTYESQLRPHAQALVSPTFRSAFAYGPLETMYPLMVQCGWILIAVTEHKLLQGLVDSMYQALDITPRKPGRKHMSIWRLASTAAVYLRHTKLAIFLLENITKVEQETLPEANPVRLASQYNLARAYNDNAEPEIAIPLLEHIIPIFKSISTHQDWLLSSQIELNRAYNSAGQVGKDVELLQDVIKAQEKLGNKHNILKSMHGLGIAYIANGQRENAIHTLMHVVSTYELMLDKTHPDRLSSQHELARAYNMDGQFDKSIPLLQHVVRLQEKILDADDYCLIASRYTLGSAYLAHGQTTEAIKHLEYVVDMYSRILDQTRSERLSAQYELARAYLDTKELDKALELMRHVVGVRRRVLNNAHPHRLQSARLLKDLVDGTVYD